MSDPRRVLRDLLRFFKEAKTCDECDGFHDTEMCAKHRKQWLILLDRAQAAAVEPPKPN